MANKFLIFFYVGLLVLYFNGCKEKGTEPEEELKRFPFRYAVVMKRIPESDGVEFYANTYFPDIDKTLIAMRHFLNHERLVDTLFFKIGSPDDPLYKIHQGYKGVKCHFVLGISKKWDKNDTYSSYKNFHFPLKILKGPADSVLIYHFPEDTLFSVK